MNSFIGWIGGKRLLRRTILEKFPQEGVSRYIEVFGGAGWVLFSKEKNPAQLEVFNDLDGDLINLYRCIKYHREAVQEELRWLLSSREQFYDYKEQLSVRGLTDIQRAARFFYLIKISFGSDHRTFATASKNIENTTEYLGKIQKRLQGVIIEQKDFEDLIKVYDRSDALFYLDPPYVGTEKYYKAPFAKADHQRLANILRKMKGRFILSYNDDPIIHELYADCNIDGAIRNNTLAGNNSSLFPELIITNFREL